LASCLLLVSLTPVARTAAQQASSASAAGRGGGRGQVVSPEVRADGTITFRFSAPNAREVTLIGELDGKTYPMSRNATGVWEVTVGPWPHDVYNYQFRVDAVEGRGGVIAMDPINPSVKLGFGGFPPANLVEVPGKSGLEFDDAKNVQHGSVRIETYHSTSLGVPRTGLDLHAAWLRRGSQPISRFLSAAWIRQHRIELDAHRPGQSHHGQPARGRPRQADDHR
jgi:hypothetical protein